MCPTALVTGGDVLPTAEAWCYSPSHGAGKWHTLGLSLHSTEVAHQCTLAVIWCWGELCPSQRTML